MCKRMEGRIGKKLDDYCDVLHALEQVAIYLTRKFAFCGYLDDVCERG